MPTTVRSPMPRGIAALALALPLAAQSSWVDLQPPGGVSAAGVSASEHLVLYRNGTYLRVFSAITGQWYAHSPSAGTTPALEKDLLLVPESDRWTAFSAYTGAFDVLLLTLAGTSLVRSDSVACVVDGSLLHSFSAFTGHWVTRSLPAGWQLQVGARVALLASPPGAPAGVSAFDCYTGQWVDLPAQTPAASGGLATGDVAMTSSATMLFGFSAQRGAWNATPVPVAQPLPYAQPLYFERVLAALVGTTYSGRTGTFAPPPAPIGTLLVSQSVAAVNDGAIVHACSASRPQWTSVAAPYAQVGTGLVVAGGAGQLHVIDPNTGAVASTAFSGGLSSTSAIARNVVAIYDAGTGEHPLYSAVTGQWHTPPANTLAENAWVADDSALCRTTNGDLVAFSARTGAFVPLNGSALTRYNGFAAADATSYHVFDAAADRWLSQARTAATGFGAVFAGGTMLATDATRAFGFATRGHRFDAVPLPEPVADVQVRAGVGFVRTANHLLAFRGLPDTVFWQDEPEGIYGVAIGTTAHSQVRTPPGSVALVAFGPVGAGPVALPPFGDLWIDPAAVSLVLPATVAGASRAMLDIAVPNLAALRGTSWFEQALTLATGGAIRLDPPSTLVVF